MTRLYWAARLERGKRHLQLRLTGFRPCTARERNWARRQLAELDLKHSFVSGIANDDLIIFAESSAVRRSETDYVAYL